MLCFTYPRFPESMLRVVDFNEADRKISLSTKALEAPAEAPVDEDIADVDIEAVAAQEDAE